MKNILRLCTLLAAAAVVIYCFLLPGVSVVQDLRDASLRGPGVPRRAWSLHRSLTPRFEAWARERVRSKQAATAALHDVPTTEWPMFSAVFYLMATEQLQEQAGKPENSGATPPLQYAEGAVHAARDLILDPSHHTWVRTHWGDNYLHRENVFFRALLIAGLTSHENLTHDGTALAVLRDQTDTLARDLDGSRLGLLHDYPGECYPIDVLPAIAFIRRADATLGTDHSAFVARAPRAFEGPLADPLGLIPFRMNLQTAEAEQPSRGVGMSWIAVFAPDLWPDRARNWYTGYERHFWQDRGWAAGFREQSRETPDSDWFFEVDAGPVIGGFGTAASAFGIAGARRNGRFDHAYSLSAQMVAASWPLPDGTLLGPRLLSHAAAAPYLGESAIVYFLSVQPSPHVAVVREGKTPGLVWFSLLVYFGVSALAFAGIAALFARWRRGWWHPRAALK
jgi:hypothetical protein